MKKILALFIVLTLLFCCTACSEKVEKTENLRVVSYLVATDLNFLERLDTSHFKDLTDIIVFGIAGINTKGEVVLNDNFDEIVVLLKRLGQGYDLRWHLNLNNYYETDQETEMKNAFLGSVLPANIRNVLEKYEFDGVFFDYEYPYKASSKRVFGKFLVNLKNALGDDFIIGAALSSWCAKLPSKAIASLDMVELMSYDNWDEKGMHSTMELARQDVKKMLRLGYKRSQIDLGLPFYGRPTTKEARWYNYFQYYDKIDENGLTIDEETSLTASFNTSGLIYEKTNYAINSGLGGVMVWHYACDVSADNDASLFNAISRAKNGN